jgi:hypothetical protein
LHRVAEEPTKAENTANNPETPAPAPETESTPPTAEQIPAAEPVAAAADAPIDVQAGDAVSGEGEEVIAVSTRTHKVPTSGLFWGTGRRKTSIARVRILPGGGKLLINKRELDKYFTEEVDRERVLAPLKKVSAMGRYDVFVNVHGGGTTGPVGCDPAGAGPCTGRSRPGIRSDAA